MPPVRRHRIGDQMPSVIHPDPDPAAINLCRDLAAEADAQAVILFGSRAGGGWDEQSDLDLIIVHPAADDKDGRRKVLGRVLAELRERHYPGHVEYDSPHQGVADGLMVETPQHYHAGRRTLNHVIARAAREGRIFTRDPREADDFRHEGDVEAPQARGPGPRQHRAAAGKIPLVCRRRSARSPTPPQCPHRPGAKRPRAAVELGSGAPVHPGRHLPTDSVVEIAAAIARHDAGWTREFRSNLERIDQYSGCGCEVVVTDPIDDVPSMWRDLESDRIALWERIRALSGYDLAQAQSSSDLQT